MKHYSFLIALMLTIAVGQAHAQTQRMPAPRASAAPATQGPANALQGFSQNRDQPVRIEAATLEVRDKDRMATFSGNVHVIQGDTDLRSKSLVVYYEENSGKGGIKAAQPG